MQSYPYMMWPEPALPEDKNFDVCLQWGLILEPNVGKQYEAQHTLLHTILWGRKDEERGGIKSHRTWNLSAAEKEMLS